MALQHRLSHWFQLYPVRVLWGTVAIALVGTGCAQIKQQLQQATTPPANAATVALADHLTQTGAKLYGTYWCPYCNRQEAMFGTAISKVQVVECDPQGENAQPQACAKANISSYPTWEIQGQLYRGMRSLDELAVLSDYKGSMDFSN
ncbi:MAG: hypothetical protein NW220_03585 [Leptolyngbyaceae cyanobacterium bins.349]|nr:hypothetical protein [Leptolyngbyaceae cyanobacterium bins.349]